MKQAKSYIQAYLSSSDEDYREVAEHWLETIVAKEQNAGNERAVDFASQRTAPGVGPSASQ